MKTFRTFVESIIDIPRSTYAPGVFDESDTKNPKIKSSVISMIDKQIRRLCKRISCYSKYFDWFYTYKEI